VNRFITRHKITLLVALHDLFMTFVALSFTLYLRFEGAELTRSLDILFDFVPYFTLFAGSVYAFFSLYSAKWRFASLPDLLNIAKAVLVLCFALLVIDYLLSGRNYFGLPVIGKKAIIIYALMQSAFLGMPRLIYRYYRTLYARKSTDELQNLIVIGGANDVEAVSRGVELKLLEGRIFGFLSPFEKDAGTKVRGIKNLGKPNDIEQVLTNFALRGLKMHQAVILPEIFQNEDYAGEILGTLRKNGVAIKTFTLDEGKKHLERVHDEDILLRSLVKIDIAPLKELLAGKKVMITGGGGSIGSEITMQVARLGAGEVIIVENSEPALYHILERLELAGLKGQGILCDIREISRLKEVFAKVKPHLIYHAAALKHVPYLEEAPVEALKTNTFGTMNVVDCAKEFKAEAFVLISTDKATRPTSVLGATKRLAELYVQMMDKESVKQRFIAVRFGNVLGTSGSVVPRFAKQIAEGGPVTVTHKDMVRYFMTVKEATSLVLTSSSHALKDKTRNAAIYVLNMGQPVQIYALAERMIRMAGFTPHHDILIEETGVRPGERLNEELFHPEESDVDIGIAGIVAADKSPITSEVLIRILSELKTVSDERQVVKRLQAVVPGYKPSEIVGQIKTKRVKTS
jgi:FlaA1/EpsC-like NDP-sugar epimerase